MSGFFQSWFEPLQAKHTESLRNKLARARRASFLRSAICGLALCVAVAGWTSRAWSQESEPN